MGLTTSSTTQYLVVVPSVQKTTLYLVSLAPATPSITSLLVVVHGGAIYTSDNVVFSFNGTNNFVNNSAMWGGAICALLNTVLTINGTNNFINNSADNGGAICADFNSTLIFNRTINFSSNRAETCMNSIRMEVECILVSIPHSLFYPAQLHVYWENNHATLGGVIYVHDASLISYCTKVTKYAPKEECFFQLPGQNLSNGIDAQLIFKNNSADAAESVLYGGAINICKLNDLDSYSSGHLFDMIVHIEDDNTNSYISSNPIVICPCERNLPKCNVS